MLCPELGLTSFGGLASLDISCYRYFENIMEISIYPGKMTSFE
jgi:hypothetical protein